MPIPASRAKQRLMTRKLTYAGLFLAIALVLPFITGQIPEIGSMLCPMHIPALLCGFLCGWPWGLAVGCAAPLLSSLVNSMPKIFPDATVMSFELAAYGAVAGLMYALLPRKWRAGRVYAALLIAMIAGRVVYAVVYFLLLKTGLVAVDQAFLLFVWTRAVVKPILGIVLQILLVPVLVLALERAGLTLNKGRKTE